MNNMLEEDRKETIKFIRKKERASREVISLIENYQKFTKVPTELNSLLNALHAMANRDDTYRPNPLKEFDVEGTLSELNNEDFSRLCEIARVTSKQGINAYDYGWIDYVLDFSGQLYSAVFEEAIRRFQEQE